VVRIEQDVGMSTPISFDTTGFTQVGDQAWQDRTGDVVALHYFDLVPDLPAGLDDIETIRSRLAVHYGRGGGTMIECDPVLVSGVPGLRQILKLRNPSQQSGQVFMGTLLLPRANSSAVVQVQCVEYGLTGVRESSVMAQVGPDRFFHANPYAPQVDLAAMGALPSHVADEQQYDAMFPNHPLSRLRGLLGWLARTAHADPQFQAEPPFKPGG
jgi:hypothetical protein